MFRADGLHAEEVQCSSKRRSCTPCSRCVAMTSMASNYLKLLHRVRIGLQLCRDAVRIALHCGGRDPFCFFVAHFAGEV